MWIMRKQQQKRKKEEFLSLNNEMAIFMGHLFKCENENIIYDGVCVCVFVHVPRLGFVFIFMSEKSL